MMRTRQHEQVVLEMITHKSSVSEAPTRLRLYKVVLGCNIE
jgi:hypothetical protein